jgi:hypothetical protein
VPDDADADAVRAVLQGETVAVWRYAEFVDAGAREADDFIFALWFLTERASRLFVPDAYVFASWEPKVVPFGSDEHVAAIVREARYRS